MSVAFEAEETGGERMRAQEPLVSVTVQNYYHGNTAGTLSNEATEIGTGTREAGTA